MYIVMLGAPGSGKGTVGKLLAEELNLMYISTGDIFRKDIKEKTELGIEADKYISKGQLVPDDITINMVKEIIEEQDKSNGIIFDGFPRTLNQAIQLEEILKNKNAQVDIAVDIIVPFDEIIDRISNRRNCMECSTTYSLKFQPPKIANKCDKCGGELYQREDQKPEIVKTRLEVYEELSNEVIAHYKEKNILYSQNAGDTAGITSFDVVKILTNYIKNEM